MSDMSSTPRPPSIAEARPPSDAALLERTLFEVKRVIVGQDRMVERMLVCLLARGHCLIEGVPGLAKTLAVETLASAVGGSFVRNFEINGSQVKLIFPPTTLNGQPVRNTLTLKRLAGVKEMWPEFRR